MEMNKLPERIKGIIFVAAGCLLLLYQFNILRKPLNFYIIVFLAFYMIVIGFFKLDGMKKIQKLINKRGK